MSSRNFSGANARRLVDSILLALMPLSSRLPAKPDGDVMHPEPSPACL